MVRSIGADHVVDYTQEDFTQGTRRYDLIIDNVATHSLSEYRRVLTPTGALVMVGGQDSGPWMMATLLRSMQAVVLSPFIRQKFLFILADLDKNSLGYLGDLMQAGKVTPVIDRTYTLTEVPAAIRYLEQGHARGKVVITLE
jgi:NADPH:quinone reductase-like Zn-dependent oxidoreductase